MLNGIDQQDPRQPHPLLYEGAGIYNYLGLGHGVRERAHSRSATV